MNEEQQYGGLPSMSKIAALLEWMPLLTHLEAIAEAKTQKDRAMAIIAALRVAANKTNTQIDNDVLDRAQEILSTPDGEALLRVFVEAIKWVAAFAEANK